jgi:alpha-2-macroglobulin
MGLLRMLGRLLAALFGRVDWVAPAWVAALARRIERFGAWSKANPRVASGRIAAAGIVLLASYAGYRWYDSLPKPPPPLLVDFQVTDPPRTALESDTEKPAPLRVLFSESVAPLERVGKEVKSGIEVSPAIPGTWSWSSDRELALMPRQDWAVGAEYRVSLARRGLFKPEAKLEKYSFEFKTAVFTATIKQAVFYQDPSDARLKKAVATFGFSHPVDTADFESRLSMRFAAANKGVFGRSGEQLKFDVTYDKKKLAAYVHSAPLAIPQDDAVLALEVAKGLKSARGGPAIAEVISQKITVPGLFHLVVNGAELALVNNERYEPDQVLVLSSSEDVHEKIMTDALTVYLLPAYHPATKIEDRHEYYHWSWGQVNRDVLAKSQRLSLQAVPAEREWASQHSFKIHAEVGRSLYVRVAKGIHSFGGYILGKQFSQTLQVPPYPQEVRILHTGSILSLAGERKLSILTRDVAGLRVTVGRVLPGQLQHLVTQNGGRFAQPAFRDSYAFSEQNITERMVKKLPLPSLQPGKAHYETIDLSEYLGTETDSRQGLFTVAVRAYDPREDARREQRGEPEPVEDSTFRGYRDSAQSDERLILLTDLGVIVKRAVDGKADVFVASIRHGDPVVGAKIEALGRNGVSLVARDTDASGHAELPSLASFHNEREPVVYVVRKGGDLSFLPIDRGDRVLDLSRFDVGGVANTTQAERLQAYVFSDRGIYRPGDTIHAAFLVRTGDFAKDLAGVPLEVSVTDPRGRVLRRLPMRLPAGGFGEISVPTEETSPTGNYELSVFIVKDGHAGDLLGTSSVRVQEFLPDRLKLNLHLSAESLAGWVQPGDLKATLQLANLFGTPAANRRITAEMTLTPAYPSFAKYPDYQFYDAEREKKSFAETLPEAKTNEAGEAQIELNLQRFVRATYRLNVLSRGFEAAGGRGVTAEIGQLVSTQPYLIGFKQDGDLAYIAKAAARHVELIAIDPSAKKIAVEKLKLVRLERKYVSVLKKQDNGTYRYESTAKETELATAPLTIAAAGALVTLPTGEPGTFVLSVRDANDREQNRIAYNVAGAGNLSRSVDRNAELQITLNKHDFAPGEDIELQIKAPYTGAGLITIERDRVYTHQWFKTTTTAAIEHIRVPAGLEGNGYVSVSFARSIHSDEIYMSPLSYGVVPFSVALDKHRLPLELAAPTLVKSGELLKIQAKTPAPTRLVVFAVDEGILQVARYKNADPLGFFFQKRALDVQTAQILDLVLPELHKLGLDAAPGGDAAGALGKFLNPFRRKRDKPVAYWSGIVEVGPAGHTFEYRVPDYFNGALRVMALAVSRDAVGFASVPTTVRADFVLSPNVPATVAPGDEFEVSVGVANNLVGSGKNASLRVSLSPARAFTIIGDAARELKIAEGREGAAVFRLRANAQLGSQSLTFGAMAGSARAKITEHVSVRPAVPYRSSLLAGMVKNGSKDVPLGRKLLAEHRIERAGISSLPLGLAHGLVSYLEEYPYGCTEQLVSGAMPALVLRERPEFAAFKVTPEAAIAKTLSELRARQTDEGGFSLWSCCGSAQQFASVYAMFWLVEARERGVAVPADMLAAGNVYLRDLASMPGASLAEERVRASAIYVITRQGQVTSPYVAALLERLEQKYPQEWRADLTAAYLAATYQLMRQQREADALIAKARFGVLKNREFADYYDGFIHDSALLYLLARHFPERLKSLPGESVAGIVDAVAANRFSTLGSAYAILAFEAYAKAEPRLSPMKLAIGEIAASGALSIVDLPAGLLPGVPVSSAAVKMRFTASGDRPGYFFVNQSGFDSTLPRAAIKNGIEVFREFTDAAGHPLNKVMLGAEVQVHLKLRALGRRAVNSAAIVDLLPGGFELVMNDSAAAAAPEEAQEAAPPSPIALASSTWTPEYADLREDRVVLFGSIGPDIAEYSYKLRATNAGKFMLPPSFAESMYDRRVQAQGIAAQIEVTAPPP